MGHLLPPSPVVDLADYRTRGGGDAMRRCLELGREGVLGEIRASGLRGRGGGAFPTGIKWSGLAGDDAETKFVVCNAAEGEPGTYKDRAIMRSDPFQVLEGLAVAAFATGAFQMFIGIKAKSTTEIDRLQRAATELIAAGLLGDRELIILEGPDDYLFGEEKGMLEVIEGRDPLPRLYPPYAQGLFERPNGPKQPVLVNNVETLANVPHILANGAAWFRGIGTERSPGTMVCTVGGDVAHEGVAEVEMGTSLRHLVEEIGGGTAFGMGVKMVLSGVSSAPLPADRLDTPISFEAMESAGSALGSAGFIVFDESACATRVAAAASAFLYRGSCGQCPPCKLGTAAITEGFVSLAIGRGRVSDIEEIAAWTIRVTDANRCGLGAGQRALGRGILDRFPEDLAHHLDGSGCPTDRKVQVTTIEDWDEPSRRFRYSAAMLEDRPGS
jgi:NADH-quinone oxidoreductase subunit F